MSKIEVSSERQAHIRAYRVLQAKAKVRSLDFILVKEKATGGFLTGWGQGRRRRRKMCGDYTIRFQWQ